MSFAVLGLDTPLPPLRVTVTEEDVAIWARIHGDRADLYPAGTAPPYILYYPTQNLLNIETGGPDAFAPSAGGGSLARYALRHHGPVPIGKSLDITGEVIDKYVRRGLGYVVWRADVRDDHLLVQSHTKTWAFRIPADVAAEWPERAGGGDRPAQSPDEAPFGPLRYELTREAFSDFEGPNHPNDTTHTNIDLAKKAGFPNVRVQGGLVFGVLNRLLLEQFGDSFLKDGEIDVRFVQSAYAGEILLARGAAVTNAGGSRTCRVWAENDSGTTVAAGTAAIGG